MGLIEYKQIDYNPVLPGSGCYNFIYFIINPVMVMSIKTWYNSVYKSEQGPHSCRNIQIFSRKKTIHWEMFSVKDDL